ncbi:type VI secretion system protein TssA [Ramlibacter albus]|uniref:Type VI secretion system protein TssA n=1 Tax=Ramlibacter albus TaxID=2079448 RepID=A0A923M7U3_9BURK|nr:type VI secretion system protein TssA [Ramlibacter albus]MBC5764488.1 type VI secretion system protein TssA [Ramlibacter albus]
MPVDVQAELGPLLAALPGDDPCGPSMRFEPVFTEIRLAREEDDPSLPMRQWERPLKKADWALIVDRCTHILSKQSKDLQVAAWLTEAWTRQKGLGGLEKGLCLVRELVAQYWQGVHPRIDEDGDSDARVAPLQWLNESMPGTLRVHVVLVNMGMRKPPRITFAEWDKLTQQELSGEAAAQPAGKDDDAPVTRPEVLAKARGDKSGVHAQQLASVRESIGHIDALDKLLDGHMGVDAPNLHKLKNTLEALERVLGQFLPAAAQPEPEPAEAMMEDEATPGEAPADAGLPAGGIPQAAAPIRFNGVRTRDEAYQALEKLADFLEKTEPHSPTPYLIRRAVNWGKLPLPELMEEIMREEGDLNRMSTLLGLKR